MISMFSLGLIFFIGFEMISTESESMRVYRGVDLRGVWAEGGALNLRVSSCMCLVNEEVCSLRLWLGPRMC